ncbi:MAG: OmpA family protein [Saprospiraceae bacterium]|nr:OmpA family protein [Saprospiraceae bacterium]
MNYITILTAALFLCSSDPGPEPMYTLEKLTSRINTKYDEINPVVSLDGETLYFTRVGHPSFDKTLKVNEADFSQTLSFNEYSQKLKEIYNQLGEVDCTDPVSSAFNQDIWIAASDKDLFDKVEHPSYPLNSALPNSVCAVTTDPSKIVIVNQFFKDGSMQKGFSFAQRGSDTWQFPEPLFIYDYHNIDAGVNLTLSKDNEVMILSLAKEDSRGMNDLYVSFRIHTTLWSAPEHMGSILNTSANEITPFISDDKQFIFFSSDRAGNNRGQDIYISERLDDSWTNWSTPEALPLPINSEADEAQPFLNRRSGYLYFTSTREGSSDIFRVKYFHPNPKKDRQRPLLVNIPPERTMTKMLTCLVVDATTGEAIDAEVSYGPLTTDEFTHSTVTGKKGLAINPENEKLFKFQVSREGYISKTQKLDLSSSNLKEDGIIRIAMDPIKVNTRISMDPIFFMRGNERILSGSYSELDRLASILRQHPKIQVNINGHTDNVGDQWALYELSENRAIAVKQYLVRSGIESYRIKTKGYGPSKPITDNSTEVMRARNRRVEVVITKI